LSTNKKSPDFLNQGFCNFFLFRVYPKLVSHSLGIFGLPCTSALIELKQYPTSNVLLRSFCQVAVCVNIRAMINFTFINMRNYATFVGIEPTLTFNVKIKAWDYSFVCRIFARIMFVSPFVQFLLKTIPTMPIS
jgi:hypothetical protein